MTENGYTYERAAITEWFNHHSTDPLTNTEVANTLIPNRSLKEAIEEVTSQCIIMKKQSKKKKAASSSHNEEPHAKKNNTTPATSSSSSSSSSFSGPHTPFYHFPNGLSQISLADISIVINAFVREGIDSPEALADIVGNKFTDRDNVEKIVLRIHKKLRGDK